MKQLDERTAKAIYQLFHDSNFQIYMDWLQGSFIEILANNVHIENEVKTRWNQGQAQCLGDQIDIIESSKQTVERFNNSKDKSK
jgi:hypothetical protein